MAQPEGGRDARLGQVLHLAQLIPATTASLWLPAHLYENTIISHCSLEEKNVHQLVSSEQSSSHTKKPVQTSMLIITCIQTEARTTEAFIKTHKASTGQRICFTFIYILASFKDNCI